MRSPKRNTATNWLTDYTIYPSGLVLIETDTGVQRIADGGLPYGLLPIAYVGPDILTPDAVTIAYAATITPNSDTTEIANVGTLTGNITIANPTGTQYDGQLLRFRFTQDATGSRTLTWGANFAFGTDVTTAMIPSTASAKWEQVFMWNTTDSKWRAQSIVRGF